MNLKQKKYSIILLTFSLFLYCCESRKYSEYFQKELKDWEDYFLEINNDGHESLKNSVLLILKSSECSPTLAELKWWDNYRANNPGINIRLIVLDRYSSRFQTFLNHEKIKIPAYRDSAGIVLERNLIPRTPMKILFDEAGTIIKLAAIDIKADEENFILTSKTSKH